ncbi:MAG: class I SAM-dependent methyltransferase, partial [Chitinophagales bacterium]
MKTTASNLISEEGVAKAFDKQAAIFDAVFSKNQIVQYKREKVRRHVDELLKPASHILELNAGTGEDAIYFARRGHRVHATDLSLAMGMVRLRKIQETGLDSQISSACCSFSDLGNLSEKGPYDMVFSNFAGLNCTPSLENVLDSLDPLVKPGGLVTLVLLPKICFWEMALALMGNWKTAFRRFSGKKGTKAHIEGEYFRCWYYNPSFVVKRLQKSFTPIMLEGLCSLVPPSYLENFPLHYPRLYSWLRKQEQRSGNHWPWN